MQTRLSRRRHPGALEIDGAHPVRSMLRLLDRYRWRVVISLLLFLAKDLPVWLLPVITANVIDVIVQHRPLAQLWLWGALACALLISNYPTSMAFVRLSSRVFRTLAAQLRNTLTNRLQSLSIGFHARTSAAIVQSKIVRDVENIELALGQGAPGLISALGILIGAIVMTAILVPSFVPVFAITVPLAAALVSTMRRRSQTRNEEFRRRVEGLSRNVGEMAALIPITRAHGLEDIAQERVAASAESVRSSGFSLDRLNGRFAVTSWVSYQLLGVGCLIAAACAALTGILPITAGQVVLLSTYFTMLTGAILQILGLAPTFTQALESIKSVAEVLNEPDVENNNGKKPVNDTVGEIVFDRVTYRFPGEEIDALRDIVLTVHPGETIAFVGSSGSGKSTMLNLSLGFLRPTRGRVLLDGQDMEDLDLRSYRRFVSVVPQEPILFDGSIRENITYGMTRVDDAQVESALRDANALEFVSELPGGWDTVVGDRGARLSGGQRQRLAIARAVVRNPQVLLLDEATSALDSVSELLVQDALDRLMAGRTTLVVAHRLSTVRAADRIIVLEQGVIVEQGRHGQLLEANGRYATLFRAQAG